IRRSVGIVGRLRLGAPLAEPGPKLLLGSRSYPVTGSIGAVASEHERNTRLVVSLVGGLGRLRNQLAVKYWRRFEGRNANARLDRSATKDLFGTKCAQFGQRGQIRSLDPHRMREVDADRLSRHRIVRIDAVSVHRPRGQHAV